ncbi:MAG: hypothetical protein JKX99_02025 [Robiginitomaculum sp.]|nr:hypothetical protein [Robiginitomaculum sp.]
MKKNKISNSTNSGQPENVPHAPGFANQLLILWLAVPFAVLAFLADASFNAECPQVMVRILIPSMWLALIATFIALFGAVVIFFKADTDAWLYVVSIGMLVLSAGFTFLAIFLPLYAVTFDMLQFFHCPTP